LRSKTSFRRLRSTRAGEPGGTVLTLASDPSTRAPLLQSAARIGSCTVAFLRRGVPLPTHSGSHSLAGRLVLPSVRPAALMGFASLRSVAPQRVSRHFCRPGPTCRSRRAPAPIDFRRGDPNRPVGIAEEPEVDEADLGRLAFDFWASLPSAGRARGYRCRGTRSCHGLCLLQGCGHAFVHPCGLVPVTDHPSP